MDLKKKLRSLDRPEHGIDWISTAVAHEFGPSVAAEIERVFRETLAKGEPYQPVFRRMAHLAVQILLTETGTISANELLETLTGETEL